jgi:glycosyltransferase involved in cell wall biosynthesis
MGTLRDDQLRDVYSAADVSAVPSSALEGFGLVVLESAACGTPSIVSDVGGLPEAVSGLDRGLVVAAGDAGAWSDRLASAARGELPTRADTRRFAERFDWQPLAERHRTLHRRLVAGEHDQRLRVVYLDHVARLSGAEIALLRLLEHLSEVNAHVILGEDGPLARRLSEAGISVEVLPVAAAVRDLRRDAVHPGTISPSVLAGAAAYTVRLARRLHRLRPDLVHTNSLKAGVYGSVAARAARLPVVWHVHDRIASDYLPASSATVVRWMVRHLAGGVIANSNATMASLGTERGGPVRSVVPSIIPSPRPLPGPRRSGAGPTTFGMVGRIAPWKGQDLFLRAFAQAFPGGGERAVLVGSAMFGEDAYEAELIKLVDHLDLGARVEFRGFRDDVFGELASFDVLVHASLIPEPFGQSVLEAMASGLAVIAADAGGPAEIIVDGVNGRLFASTDPISLAQAMRELAGQQSERARLGAAAVAAAERCNPASVTAQVMDLYASVLAVVH